jgi:hypothetical protein
MLLALSENPQRYQAVGTGRLLGAQASPREFANPVGRDRRRRLYGEARLTPKNTTDWHGEALSGSNPSVLS